MVYPRPKPLSIRYLVRPSLPTLTTANCCHLLYSPPLSPTIMSLKRKAGTTPSTNGDASKKPKKNADLTSFFGAPKITPSAAGSSSNLTASSAAAAKFDKAKWVAGLNAEQKDLLKLEIDTLDDSWLAVLKEEIVSRDFLDLKRFLKSEVATQKIYPPMDLVYSWYVPSWGDHTKLHSLCCLK